MRLKLSLRNSVKAALLCNLLFVLGLAGCAGPIEPTYKENDIPKLVKKICQGEYNLDVTTKRSNTTLWIYAPLNQILDKEYGVKEDKILDEGMVDKLRNILTTIGRVLISSDNTPEFFALLASDINLGLDYTIIGSVLDMQKSYSGILPWMEANRRYLVNFAIAPEAIGDSSGAHMLARNITLPQFLSEQIAQRIAANFQDETHKKYFKVDKFSGKFQDGTLSIEYSIQETGKPDKKIDPKKEILDIATYCIQTYEFKDFSFLELVDVLRQDKTLFSKPAIWSRPGP